MELKFHLLDLEHTKLENIPNKIKFALENGYRLIDTAKIYKNEEEVGKGINEYLSSHKEIKREDLYIVTKLWQDEQNDPVNALKNSLKRLNLSYVDLYLIHWPLPNYSNNKVEKKFLYIKYGKEWKNV
jgi:diketogulonate reductase-like aldo/keto reductase